MKSISLSRFERTKDGYTVYFGNATWHHVPSKRAARKLLAEANRFLTLHLVELNEIYIFAFTQYRLAYFIFRNEKNGNKTNYGDLERKVKHHLQNVEDFFDRIFYITGSRSDNENFWIFITVGKLRYALTQAVSGLAEINRMRNNTVLHHMLLNYLDRLADLDQKAKHYSNPENA